MAGTKNDVLVAKNADYSQAAAPNPQSSENNGLISDGQMWIGRTAVNLGGTHISVGTVTSPLNSGAVVYSAPNIGVIPYNCAKWIVDPTSNRGTHQTIGAALTAASSGETIFIRPGVYTENLTLKAGVNLCAFPCDALTPNVTITGTLSASFAGTCTLSGLLLQTNSAVILSLTGTNATIVQIESCVLSHTNANAISYNVTNASSKIILTSCQFTTTTGFTLFTGTTTGLIDIRYCNDYLPAATSSTVTQSTLTNGTIAIEHSLIRFPITVTSGAGAMNFSESNVTNVACLTLVTSGTFNIQRCLLGSGNAVAVSIGAGCTVNMTGCSVTTSNTNAISGAGTLNVDPTAYVNSGSILAPTTITDLAFGRLVTFSSTVNIAFGGSSTSVTFSTRLAQCWIIGKLVHFTIQLTLTNNGTGTGAATITGLPVTASSTLDQTFGVTLIGGSYPAGATNTIGIIAAGSTTIALWGVGTTTFSQLTDTNITNTSTVQLQGFYWST